MDYKEKYLKYKLKYYLLKEYIGGAFIVGRVVGKIIGKKVLKKAIKKASKKASKKSSKKSIKKHIKKYIKKARKKTSKIIKKCTKHENIKECMERLHDNLSQFTPSRSEESDSYENN